MKRILPFLLLGTSLFYFSCSKSSESRCVTISAFADTAEVSSLRTYLTAKGINATADPRGFFYVVNNQGDTTQRPTICSIVQVSYTGRLANGVQFDASNFATLNLGSLVLGWQEGLPLIGKGGSITLYIPPSLGYGATATGTIPASSNLIFNIDLLNIP